MTDGLIVKPNRWSCSLAAFAMATGKSIQQLIGLVGHDGSAVVFPSLPEPMCRRGFHHQELILASLSMGFTVTPLELIPAIQPTPLVEYTSAKFLPIDDPARKTLFVDFIRLERGVITGRGRVSNHAVAFARGAILDPDGEAYPFSFQACEARGFFCQCLWIVRN